MKIQELPEAVLNSSSVGELFVCNLTVLILDELPESDFKESMVRAFSDRQKTLLREEV